MERVVACDKSKILDDFAAQRDGLRSNARASRRKILGTDFGNQCI